LHEFVNVLFSGCSCTYEFRETQERLWYSVPEEQYNHDYVIC